MVGCLGTTPPEGDLMLTETDLKQIEAGLCAGMRIDESVVVELVRMVHQLQNQCTELVRQEREVCEALIQGYRTACERLARDIDEVSHERQ